MQLESIYQPGIGMENVFPAALFQQFFQLLHGSEGKSEMLLNFAGDEAFKLYSTFQYNTFPG